MIRLIRKYLERNGDIVFKKDSVDGHVVTRIRYTGEFFVYKMNFLEWFLTSLLDNCSGFYGYRITIISTPMKIKR